MTIEKVSRKAFDNIMNEWCELSLNNNQANGEHLIGKYYTETEGGFTAIDNEHGDAWTEAFADETSAIMWLEGDCEVEELGHCDVCHAYTWEGIIDEDQGKTYCMEHKPHDDEIDGDTVFYTTWNE